MEENHNRRWLIIGFFLLIGLLFVGFIYMAVVGTPEHAIPAATGECRLEL